MVGAIDLNRPKCVCLRGPGGSGEPPLPYRKSERAQIVARLIKTATAERPHEFAPVLQAFRSIFQSRHAKKSSVNENERGSSSSSIIAA